jgi:hypothetical protein
LFSHHYHCCYWLTWQNNEPPLTQQIWGVSIRSLKVE